MPRRAPQRRRRKQVLLSAEDVLELLRAEIQKAGSQLAWTQQSGANRTSVNLLLNGRRRGRGPAFEKNILDALGLEQVVVVAYTPRKNQRSSRRPAGDQSGTSVSV